ncbi:hypothetical protein QP028_01585 [Corynebacterium suedekumii]|nr:hypothetical protein QP028_01585 [Corynebacterium suedekumii]
MAGLGDEAGEVIRAGQRAAVDGIGEHVDDVGEHGNSVPAAPMRDLF